MLPRTRGLLRDGRSNPMNRCPGVMIRCDIEKEIVSASRELSVLTNPGVFNRPVRRSLRHSEDLLSVIVGQQMEITKCPASTSE